MANGGGVKVSLHLYDLSQGMARAMSAQLLGKQIDGVWHTGVVRSSPATGLGTPRGLARWWCC